MDAPSGWLLVETTPDESDIELLFLPPNQRFEDSEAVVYSRETWIPSKPVPGRYTRVPPKTRPEGVWTISEEIKDELNFLKRSHPATTVEEVGEIETKEGKKGTLFRWSLPDLSSYRGTCCFHEGDLIVHIELTASHDEIIEKWWSEFLLLAGSFEMTTERAAKSNNGRKATSSPSPTPRR